MGVSANSSDVRFDYDGALRLARSLWSFADELEACKGDRHRLAEQALRSWRGPFGNEFSGRERDEQVSLQTVIAGLRSDADAWAEAWKQAMDEQNRRLWARRVEQMKEDRSAIEKVGDFFTGFDYPPKPAPVAKPSPGGFYATACLTG